MSKSKLTPHEWGKQYGSRAFMPDHPFGGFATSADARKDCCAKTHVEGTLPDKQEAEDERRLFMSGHVDAISKLAADELARHEAKAKKGGWMPPKGHDPNQGLHDFNQN